MTAAGVHPNLKVMVDTPVARLVIDRPEKRNALSLAMWEAVPEVFARLAADPSVAVVVVEGAGGEAFASGADIGELLAHAGEADAASAFMMTVQRAEQAVAACRKPVIAMIAGSCYGGGLELAMACDVRFAAIGSRFAAPPARLGVVYSLSSTRRLVELVGPGRARDLLFSGRDVDSGEAAAIGLIEREIAAADLEAETLRYARTVGRRSQVSVRVAKRVIRAILDGAVEEDEDLHRLRVDAMLSADLREGASAFLERRRPDFPSCSPPQR
jgi:enoyl-CoA hydratase/carnithine racemase